MITFYLFFLQLILLFLSPMSLNCIIYDNNDTEQKYYCLFLSINKPFKYALKRCAS